MNSGCDLNVTISYRGVQVDAFTGYEVLYFSPDYGTTFNEEAVQIGIVEKLSSIYKNIRADGILGLGYHEE